MRDDYQVGGSLPADALSYVKRQADDVLHEKIKFGDFCYVLNSRQVGKSSLRVQVMQRLESEGVACAAIDLTQIGGDENVTADQWYAGFVRKLWTSFDLTASFDFRQWWREQDELSSVQRFSEFIETVLLEAISDPIAIFIDEIDTVQGLTFPLDDFFTLIRDFYNQRADNSAFKRLTFCFLGVAAPSNLIRDKTRTPFNIGHAISLQGFHFYEAEPLLQGLGESAERPEAVLQAILCWTNGQPFLTQKLCRLTQTLDTIPAGEEDESVSQLVRSRIINNWEAQDEPEHLRTIRNRLLANETQSGRILGLYQRILQRGEVPADGSAEQSDLRLSGLIREDHSSLHVANSIYAEVFDSVWINECLLKLRPYGVVMAAWLASAREDKSRLLRGQALRDALIWANESRRLDDEDRVFLLASQEEERADTQTQLEAEAQYSQILSKERERAEAELLDAKQKLNKIQIETKRLIERGRETRRITILVR